MNIYKRNHHKLLKDIEDGKFVSPVKAIRAFCLECVGYNGAEVESCSAEDSEETRCPLFPFRFGRNSTFRKKGVKEGSTPSQK